MKLKIITRTIWILSFVSLFTDISSEMLYPVMPVYLREIGFSIALIGILEGLAEATAGLSKGYFGKLSDVSGKRVPFVRLGYLLSALSKPLMAVFIFPAWIFFVRTLDRFGKGIRTGARDAILSDETIPANKGKVFGFHRAFDTLGATIGPIAALIFLKFYPGKYAFLFFLAFIPGITSIFFTFFLHEKKSRIPSKMKTVSFFSFLNYWKKSPLQYRRLATGLLVFTLFNSSDIFLLLKVKESGFSDSSVIGVYIFYNLIYALASFPLGILADKIGLKKMLLSGLCLFVIVYTGFAFSNNIQVFFVLYFFYGLYAATTEGISKAWITNISAREDTATAIGTYSAFNSIMTMFASSITGLLWVFYGPMIAFLSSSVVTSGVVIYLLLKTNENRKIILSN